LNAKLPMLSKCPGFHHRDISLIGYLKPIPPIQNSEEPENSLLSTHRYHTLYIFEDDRAECSERFLSGDRYLYVSLSGSSAKELPFYAELEDVDDDIVRNSMLLSIPQ